MINATSNLPSASSPTPSFDEVVAKINKAPVAGTSGGSGSYRPSQSKKSKGRSIGFVIAGIVLLLSGAGLYFGSQFLTERQDVRQQASIGVKTPGCGTDCTTNANCPNAHTCSAGKCVLTKCTQTGVQCDAERCVQTNVANCSLNFVALDVSNFICDKRAFRDEFANTAGTYQLLQEQSSFVPGDVIVFRIRLTNNSTNPTSISVTDVLTASNLENVTFMDSNCGEGSYNDTTKTLTCPATSVAANGTVDRIFRVRVNQSTPNNTVITNTATATSGTSVTCNVPVTITTTPATPSPTPSPSSSPSPTPTPVTYACNGSCTTNEQCRTVNDNYICYQGACRLDSHPTETTCQPPATTTVGCNSTCVTNSDCASAQHICADTSEGRRCRLGTNVESASCTPPLTVTSSTPTPQPVQPKELPVAGAGDTVKYVLGGAAAIILGAAAMLYL